MTSTPEELVHQAQPDVSERHLARVYGEALLNAAERQNAAPEVLDELRQLATELAGRHAYVQAFFTSGVIGTERRQAVLEAAFGDSGHPLVLDFLLVLNEHNRLELFRTIVKEMEKLNDLRCRRFRVLVRSVVPLADDQKQRLENDLRNTFRLEPILDQRLEPDLLGGMIVRIADWVLDSSVRTQLVNLRKQLREMSSHEIQSRRDRFSIAEGN